MIKYNNKILPSQKRTKKNKSFNLKIYLLKKKLFFVDLLINYIIFFIHYKIYSIKKKTIKL